MFIVNFNDEYYLDQDFTADIGKMKEALEKVDTRGGTAFYDAVVASAGHLKKNAKLEKRVLLVVTDGEDNESQETLEQAIRRLQEENGPTVYAIGLLGEEKARRARKALQFIAEKTGGIAFFPKSLDEVDSITRNVAHDIRNQYTLGTSRRIPRVRRVSHHSRGGQVEGLRQTDRAHQERVLRGTGSGGYGRRPSQKGGRAQVTFGIRIVGVSGFAIPFSTPSSPAAFAKKILTHARHRYIDD